MAEPLTSEAIELFKLLRQGADPETVTAMERLVAEASDRDLCRINVLAFATDRALNEERVIATFLYAARLGLFELSWNVLCPGCGGVLDTSATLKNVDRDEYVCALCATGYEPSLDETVEVTFTVNCRLRRIAAHHPDALPFLEYFRQIFWGSGVDLPDDLEQLRGELTIDTLELPPGEKAQLFLELPPELLIIFDPVTHAAHFVDVRGERTSVPQSLSFVFSNVRPPTGNSKLRPGPLHLSLENSCERRVLPGIWIAGPALHNLLGNRREFLTAKRLLTNQTFRDIYRTDTIQLNQRLKITSLTFLFTDLKNSTELYHQVGDLVAFDLIRDHFGILTEIVGAEAGAVVKTIGDSVMATFPTPDSAIAAALRMREAMRSFNEATGREERVLKIGLHEGPCLVVMLNDRQDYFGQTVNIASRVPGLAECGSIFATRSVIDTPQSSALLAANGLQPVRRERQLRGVSNAFSVYEIPEPPLQRRR
jgi:class 3 adenylate cyclase